MADSGAQMSRVQRELLELKERGRVKTQADKLKDYAAPLTTPEEAQAFLASMRDKQKVHQIASPPGNLSRDGIDAWYSQQKQREMELKKRRQEAENLLRGYRSSYVPHKEKTKEGTALQAIKTKSLSEKATSLTMVREVMADPDSDIFEQPATLGIRPRIIDGTMRVSGSNHLQNASDENGGNKSIPADVSTEASTIEQKPQSEVKSGPEGWRDFVEPDPEAKFPSENGRYHLFASYACPGSHRALIVHALKGLEDVVSVSIVHPIWRLTKEGTSEEQRGWVFGNPSGEEFCNTAGRGGPFSTDFPGAEVDPFFNSVSIRDIYDKAGDTIGKYTVPVLWDKHRQTIVNNESSDIAYMLNSSFNAFAKNLHLDLYTEEDNDKLNDIIAMISPLMIHGVYRCGFAKTQSAYDKAVYELTDAFDRADVILQKQRYLTGSMLTDADIRLFVTLFRFDEVYSVYFRANARLVALTPSLLNYCRDIYQMDGVAQTCSMDHCKAHFFCSHAEWNKFSIIPKGLGFLTLLNQPHNRDELPGADNDAEDNGEI